jgi:hypothetical protein
MTTDRYFSRAWMGLLLTAACGGGGDTSASGTTGDTGGSGTGSAAETSTSDEQVTSGPVTSSTGDEPETSAGSSSSGGDDGPEPPAAYEKWLKVELPGTVCGNNSQYKFFVNYKEGAKDLMIMLEPGGACWDYEGCSGTSMDGLGAAHPDGIPDDLMNDAGQSANISPLIRRDVEGPTQDFNLVYVPYCTGDVHTGNNVIVYKDPQGVGADLEFHHAGHTNVLKIADYLRKQFPATDRLFLTGCSAGGAGALINYYFFRSKIDAQRGYLMDDSGPIFPSDGYSLPLHTKIRSSWNVDSFFNELPPGYPITDDFGLLNRHLADIFPEDRLSTVFFQRDYNYSRYSYEKFYDANAKEDIMTYWASDTKLLVNLYKTRDNLGFYLPYWRALNDSHCVSIASYTDTDIEELDMNLGDFIDELFNDDVPIGRYMESIQPDEDD